MSTIQVDPITFEVIKHRLWQINDEQAQTIRTLSTSPIVVEGNDFNVGLFTREGELVVGGLYVLTHINTMQTVVKNIMEKATEIAEGDIFLLNDPYLGALHQNDLAIVSPFYHEGEQLMWVGNVLHHSDVGGIDVGSFCVNAVDVYQEPARYFLKIQQEGKFSKEAEYTFTQNSRLTEEVALDLRAQLGAVNVAQARLKELVKECGADTIISVMKGSLDYAESKMRERISELPDMSCGGEVYMDGERAGSDRIFKVRLKLEKLSDELLFDYEGSAPQVEGPFNSTYAATYAATTTPIFNMLCGGEIDWNGAIKRCVKVKAPEGSVMNAVPPAGVSICSVGFTWLSCDLAMKLLAKVFSCSEKYRDRVCPSWVPGLATCFLYAQTEKGKQKGANLSDHRGGGAGARSFADGFDHAGHPFSYVAFMGNVEATEHKLPLLYVHRKQLIDSGGPGMYRGGLSVSMAITPYGTDKLTMTYMSHGADESNGAGASGGYPGAGSQGIILRNTKVWEVWKQGEMIQSSQDFGGEKVYLTSKASDVIRFGDILVWHPPSGGGYGDPLERDPNAVRKDVMIGAVSLESALHRYGVVLDENILVDFEATGKERGKLFQERLTSKLRLTPEMAAVEYLVLSTDVERVGEYLEFATVDGDEIVRCCRCKHILCGRKEDPRRDAVVIEEPLHKAGPWLSERWEGNSPNFVLRGYTCPSCGVLFEVGEVLRER